MMEKRRVAIVGAGPSGLPAIRHALLYGIEPVCFEASDGIGGLWRYKSGDRKVNGVDVASVMKNTIINSSKEMTAYSDFPPKAEAPNFMHNSQLYEYFLDYAKHYDLLRYVRFYHFVESVNRAEDYADTGRWNVTYRNLKDNTPKKETFDGVLIATGHHAIPYMPAPVPGQGGFGGEILHSHDFKDPVQFADKRVIVVGFGNSGGDVAVDLARIAAQTYLVSRRGVWLAPRLSEAGLPFDYIWSVRWFYWIRKLLPKLWLSRMVERRLKARFNLATFGLEPDYPFIACHPNQNEEIMTHFANGRIRIKPVITSFEGPMGPVVFSDGSQVDRVDAVIFATGYTISYPFIEGGKAVPVTDNHVRLYKYMYPPGLSDHNTLAVIGLIQPLGSIIPIAEMQSRLFYEALTAGTRLPARKIMEQDIDAKIEALTSRYLPSRRHTIQVDYYSYMEELATLVGCLPDLSKIALTDPYLAWKLIWSPTPSYVFRVIGPHPWPGAKAAILDADYRVRRGCNPEGKCALVTKKDVGEKQEAKKVMYLFGLLVLTAFVYAYRYFVPLPIV